MDEENIRTFSFRYAHLLQETLMLGEYLKRYMSEEEFINMNNAAALNFEDYSNEELVLAILEIETLGKCDAFMKLEGE